MQATNCNTLDRIHLKNKMIRTCDFDFIDAIIYVVDFNNDILE